MSDDVKRQLFQSVGQFIVVVVSSLLIYKDFAEFAKVGVTNALWQPVLQAILAVAGIWGVSRIAPSSTAMKLLESTKKPGD